MSEIKKLINSIEKNPEYKQWKKNNKDSFLCHCVKLMDSEEKGWHLGFYNKNDTITSFFVSDTGFEKLEDCEIFKHPDAKIKPLIVDEIEIDVNNAVSIAKDFAKNNYPREIIAKEIILLQNIEEGQIYNITFLTMAMNTLNIKIDSKKGNVVKHKLNSIIDFSEEILPEKNGPAKENKA